MLAKPLLCVINMLHLPQDQLNSTQCIKATSEIDCSNVFYLGESSVAVSWFQLGQLIFFLVAGIVLSWIQYEKNVDNTLMFSVVAK